MKILKHLLIVLILVLPVSGISQTTNKEIKAKIEMEDNTDYITITGFAENLTDGYKSLFYKLTVIKTDTQKNASNSSQSGRFTIEANQIKSLSKTQINLIKDTQVVILLLIYDEDQNLIGKDRIVLGEKKIEKVNSIKPKDGIEITGIVSDETKTKMGKDFYDVFYNQYNRLKLNSSKMVVVEEELSNSRTTIIKVKIDETILNEFVTKPDEEFLQEMAEDSVAKIYNYLKNLEKQNKFISQY
ncbi:CsgE family curli-type amyloid fiber assembly protein [Flavobacterium sp.]|uniref:CsgE family curli-type amyloid fiber assembly protein n=1 Tax=Flavobacterium sp. TaxID=239 RepID=UPI00286E90A7|nr:CsgE family curli-type amyloid fiber assembly protein [Flavobacterium sp.]